MTKNHRDRQASILKRSLDYRISQRNPNWNWRIPRSNTLRNHPSNCQTNWEVKGSQTIWATISSLSWFVTANWTDKTAELSTIPFKWKAANPIVPCTTRCRTQILIHNQIAMQGSPITLQNPCPEEIFMIMQTNGIHQNHWNLKMRLRNGKCSKVSSPWAHFRRKQLKSFKRSTFMWRLSKKALIYQNQDQAKKMKRNHHPIKIKYLKIRLLFKICKWIRSMTLKLSKLRQVKIK